MTTQTLLLSLFRYKASADEDLLVALTGLDGELSSASGRSALRVLDHAHTVDRIFRAHLQGTGHSYTASWMPDAPSLARLSTGMRETDRWYVDHIAQMNPRDFDEAIDFVFTDGQAGRMSRAEMLAHVVTHSGYHRGEVGRLLPQIEDTASQDVFAGYLHRAEPRRREPLREAC